MGYWHILAHLHLDALALLDDDLVLLLGLLDDDGNPP